ncbi:GNAT family N-acetyltransferase [Paucilactobacillus sp. N302-9]
MDLAEFRNVPRYDPQKMIFNAHRKQTLLDGIATTLVAEVDETVVGVAFGYPDINERAVSREYAKAASHIPSIKNVDFYADPEAFANEFYLDSIAVNSDYRGYGIATQLISEMTNVAYQFKYNRIGLNVDVINDNARRLYEKLGFHDVGQIMIGDHDYDHLQLSTAKPVLV